MGYAFSVFSVDLKKLAKVWGKNDKKLGKAIREKYAREITEADEWFVDEIVEQGAPTRARALYELLAGKPEKKQHGFQYGYALELLCQHFGERVDQEELRNFDDVLDPLLKKAKCPKTGQLLGRHVLPLPIPRPADFPEIGSVTPAGCIAGIGALGTIAPHAPDDNARMVIAEVRGWFERAKKRGLVWFVY